MTPEKPCTWTTETGWLTPEGRPCPAVHCAMPGRSSCPHHVNDGEHTCPRCLGTIRTALLGVVDQVALMLPEAIYAGLDSEAANLAGPSANPVLLKWGLINADRAGEKVDVDIDTTDPYTVLAGYEQTIRETLGHDRERLISDTLGQVVSYLSWVLTDLARSTDHLHLLEALHGDVRRLSSHLGAVLHDSRAPEKGAPCPACRKLIDDAREAGEDVDGIRAPRLTKRYATHDTTGASDRWVCPDYPHDREHQWAEAQYRLTVAGDYLQHADRLTAAQIHEVHGIPEPTLRQWVKREKVQRRGRDHRGRQLYDVQDALLARSGKTSDDDEKVTA